MANDEDEDRISAAREQAETRLDELLRIIREDLAVVPSEQRWVMLLAMMLRSQDGELMTRAMLLAAAERIVTREKLEQDLAPPPE